MNAQNLIHIFDAESRSLDQALRTHPQLRPLFTRVFVTAEREALRQAYLQLLRLSADYVQYTVPALRAAGVALRFRNEADQRWSRVLLAHATEETDTGAENSQGHHAWALADMRALGAHSELLTRQTSEVAQIYGRYFVEEAARHPYAILGAKGVLEHAAVRTADDLAAGMVASGIPGAAGAVRFFGSHGVLDVDHVREGDKNLRGIADEGVLRQIIEGAYITGGTYRALVHLSLG